MDLQSIGRLLLIGGIAVAILGGLMMLFGRAPFLQSFGNLPGDIRIQGEGFTCIFPIVSMILFSIILTIVLNIIIRIINR
jgi:hypothetical protein